jgi:endonuclease/exonuclease/phosphatase family metal-dependent hydrolase
VSEKLGNDVFNTFNGSLYTEVIAFLKNHQLDTALILSDHLPVMVDLGSDF